jgi:hypothetical protein
MHRTHKIDFHKFMIDKLYFEPWAARMISKCVSDKDNGAVIMGPAAFAVDQYQRDPESNFDIDTVDMYVNKENVDKIIRFVMGVTLVDRDIRAYSLDLYKLNEIGCLMFELQYGKCYLALHVVDELMVSMDNLVFFFEKIYCDNNYIYQDSEYKEYIHDSLEPTIDTKIYLQHSEFYEKTILLYQGLKIRTIFSKCDIEIVDIVHEEPDIFGPGVRAIFSPGVRDIFDTFTSYSEYGENDLLEWVNSQTRYGQEQELNLELNLE